MKAALRVTWAAATLAFGFAAAPLAAQDSTVPAPAPAAEEVVGPPQLQNFSLGGTATRQLETPPAPGQSGAATEPPQQAATSTAATAPPAERPSAAAPAAPTRQAETRPQPASAAAGPAPSALPQRSATIGLPPAGGLAAPPTPARTGSFESLPAAMPTSVPSADPLELDQSGPSPLPWLLALLLAGGAAAYYFRRQRAGSYAFAGAGGGIDLGSPRQAQPQPQPRVPQPAPPQAQPRMPAAAPAPRQPQPQVPPAAPRAPSIPGAIVSTRLRPWLDIEFVPGRTIVDGERATIECEVVLHNSGAAPARDVLVEARMFNAGPEQDREIAAFFERPVGKGERSGSIAPLQCSTFKLAVGLAYQQLRQFEVEGRRLFVPLIGVNALYRWSGGDAQSSAAFLIGRDTTGEKMAPFRLDLGPRIFRGLGVRELAVRLRK